MFPRLRVRRVYDKPVCKRLIAVRAQRSHAAARQERGVTAGARGDGRSEGMMAGVRGDGRDEGMMGGMRG